MPERLLKLPKNYRETKTKTCWRCLHLTDAMSNADGFCYFHCDRDKGIEFESGLTGQHYHVCDYFKTI